MRLLRTYHLQFAFALAAIATIGSLFLSEVLLLPPCVLCWVQRGLMYPATVILGIAAYSNNRNLTKYAAALSLLGMLIAGYHYFIQWFPQWELSVCSFGNPCTNRDFVLLGFITIPFMSLAAFGGITFLLSLKTVGEVKAETGVQYSIQ